MRPQEARRDYYRRKARKEGYRSRAAYKLLELNARYGIIRKGGVVLDIGCAPGGWLQAASEAVGEEGTVLGVDIRDIKPPSSNCRFLRLDITDSAAEGLILSELNAKAVSVLSDLSPALSGIWEVDQAKQIRLTLRVVSMLPNLLEKVGNGVFKAFEGDMLAELLSKLKHMFQRVVVVKPRASRSKSSEIYLVCTGFIGALTR